MSANAIGILHYESDRIGLFLGNWIAKKMVVMGGRGEYDSRGAWIGWRMKTIAGRCIRG